ncbi:hypothetical protein [Tahibacter caeni]|uniref:hypothetical protein n=1 Tax=Tahibacter caeni TaxID=1453545 RepID=UPI0021482C26|nr:hypothetical protein [Tahibacter caeni]
MRIRCFVLGLAAALVATTATAATSGEPAPADRKSRLLARMDRDGDDRISFEEYRNAMLRRFDARDRNRDGVLDGAEFPPQWLEGSGIAAEQKRLARDDFSDQLEPSFAKFDADANGQLDGAELDAFFAARHQEKQP